MATELKLKQALIQADQAGDTQAAQLFATKIKELRAATSTNTDITVKPTSFVDEAKGALESVGVIGSAAIAEPIAGIAGSVEAAGRGLLNLFGFDAGDATGEGVKTINKVKQFLTLEPETDEGKRNIELVGKLVQGGVDVANISAGGLAGLGKLATGGTIDQANKVLETTKKDGVSKSAGQAVYEATGSAGAAAFVQSLPTAALEAIGLKGLGGVKKIGKTIEKSGDLIVDSVKQAKDTGAVITSKTKDLIKDGLAVPDQGIGKVINKIDEITPFAVTTKKKLDNAQIKADLEAGTVNADTISKTLDPTTGKVKANPKTESAINLIGDTLEGEAAAINITKMKEGTKATANRMLDIFEKNTKSGDRSVALNNRPADMIGNSISQRVKAVEAGRKNASKGIGQIIKGTVGDKKVNVDGLSSAFMKKLEDFDMVITDKDGVLNFDNSNILNKGDKKVSSKELATIVKRLDSNPSFKTLHKLKRELQEIVNYGDTLAPQKLSSDMERAVKALAKDINVKLREANPSYGKFNDELVSSYDALKKVQKIIGKDAEGNSILSFGDNPYADSKLGSLSKRLGSNLASRTNIMQMIDTLESTLGKKNIKFKDDILQLVLFLEDMDKIFKLSAKEAPSGFKSQIQGAVEAKATGGVSAVTDAASKVFDKVTEKSTADKIQALRQLIKTNKGTK